MLTFLAFLACTLNGSIKVEPDSTDSTDTETDTTLPVSIGVGSTFHLHSDTHQIYDVAYQSGGTFLFSNPFFASYTGAIYQVDSDTVSGFGNELETVATATWTGSSDHKYLGVNVSVLSDGTDDYVVSNEFGVANEGNLLAAPVTGGSGDLQSFATLNISGETSGDYFGTGVAVAGGNLIVSATAPRKLWTASGSVLGTGGTLAADFTQNAAVTPSAGSGDDYNFMRIDSGSDGYVAASFGGIFQHFDLSGTPDWWFSETSDGAGEADAADYAARNTSRICDVRRLTDVYALSCFGSTSSPETMLVTPEGALVDTLVDVTDVVEGETSGGRGWKVTGSFQYFGGDTDLGGFLTLLDSDGIVLLSTPLPFDTPYQCLPKLATDGVSRVAVICRDAQQGAFFSLSL